jgi:ankyrin repeat protein
LDATPSIVDRGAEIDSKDNGGETPLMHACASDNVEIVKLLLDRGAKRDAKTDERRSRGTLRRGAAKRKSLRCWRRSGMVKAGRC